MSSVWKLEKDLCRCCHSEGSFHNLLRPRFILGQEEYYLEMLRQSYDIELEPVPGVINEITFTICETCIIRLRDAAKFKQQVLLCEKRFKDVYKDILKALTPSDNRTSIVKVEVEVPNDGPEKLEGPSTLQDSIKVEIDRLDDDDDFHMHFDDEDNEPLFGPKNEDSKKSTPKDKKDSATEKKKPKLKKTVLRQVKKKAVGDKALAAEPEAEAETAEGGEQPKKGEKIKFYLRETDYRIEGDAFICAHCDKNMTNKYKFKTHVKLKHYNFKRKFLCEYCEKEYDTIGHLNTHKLEEHGINDRHQCLACYKEFNTKSHLEYHTKVYHMLGEKFKCSRCEYETFDMKNMKMHEVKHIGTKEFHCQFCKKSFIRKTTLNFHERIHTGDKRKVCKECGQAFVQKASLNYHMTKYHPEVKF